MNILYYPFRKKQTPVDNALVNLIYVFSTAFLISSVLMYSSSVFINLSLSFAIITVILLFTLSRKYNVIRKKIEFEFEKKSKETKKEFVSLIEIKQQIEKESSPLIHSLFWYSVFSFCVAIVFAAIFNFQSAKSQVIKYDEFINCIETSILKRDSILINGQSALSQKCDSILKVNLEIKVAVEENQTLLELQMDKITGTKREKR